MQIPQSCHNNRISKSMETIIDVLSLSVDQTIRKIRALKADPQIIEFKVVVRRKQKKCQDAEKLTNVAIQKNSLSNMHDEKNTKSHRNGKKADILYQLQKQDCKRINSLGCKAFSEHRTHPNVQADLMEIVMQKEDSQGQNYGNEAKDDPVFSQLKDKSDYQTENELKSCHKLLEAKQQYSKGNYEISISILTNLLVQQQPMNIKAYMTFLLANSYYRMKNFQQSLRYYSLQYPEENPKRKAMRKSNLGALYLHLNQHQESLRNYTAALKIYKECGCFEMDLSNSYYNIGNIYLREGMYETAAKYFQIALEDKKSKGEDRGIYYAAFKLGMARRLEGKYEQSLKSLFYAFNFAQNGVGDILDLYKQIAQVYERIQKPNQSLSYYQLICDSSHSTDEDKGYGFENAARIYFELNRKQEGERLLRIAEQYYKKGKNVRKAQQIEAKHGKKLRKYQMETD